MNKTNTLFLKRLSIFLFYEAQKQPPKMFYKKAVLKKFAIFTGKHLCWSLFFYKIAGLGRATLLKKDTPAQGFFL